MLAKHTTTTALMTFPSKNCAASFLSTPDNNKNSRNNINNSNNYHISDNFPKSDPESLFPIYTG